MKKDWKRFESGDICPVCKDQALLEEWLEYPIEGWYLVCPCPGCPFELSMNKYGTYTAHKDLIDHWRKCYSVWEAEWNAVGGAGVGI